MRPRDRSTHNARRASPNRRPAIPQCPEGEPKRPNRRRAIPQCPKGEPIPKAPTEKRSPKTVAAKITTPEGRAQKQTPARELKNGRHRAAPTRLAPSSEATQHIASTCLHVEQENIAGGSVPLSRMITPTTPRRPARSTRESGSYPGACGFFVGYLGKK